MIWSDQLKAHVAEGPKQGTFVIAVVLNVYKHGAHIGLLFHILQCCAQAFPVALIQGPIGDIQEESMVTEKAVPMGRGPGGEAEVEV